MVTIFETPVIRLADTGPERRVFPRQQAYGHIQGQRLDRSPAARRNPHLAISLRDLSVGGVSGWSQTQLNAGERVLLFFPPEGMNRGFDVRGRVLRCDTCSLGYRIAIVFEATLENALRKAA